MAGKNGDHNYFFLKISKVVLGFQNFGYDFWGVGGDVWRWLCRHVRRQISAHVDGGPSGGPQSASAEFFWISSVSRTFHIWRQFLITWSKFLSFQAILSTFCPREATSTHTWSKYISNGLHTSVWGIESYCSISSCQAPSSQPKA